MSKVVGKSNAQARCQTGGSSLKLVGVPEVVALVPTACCEARYMGLISVHSGVADCCSTSSGERRTSAGAQCDAARPKIGHVHSASRLPVFGV